MAAKRALIVDDSRSARVILSRMLESYGLQVDAAETAEQAFEFLAHNRPDVIFMDHLMPGMDGFQAVQALKANPATSMIPVMMYTSQEGELYVGQARALGAVGVLPKTVKHADVSRVLYQLNLLHERRENRSAVFESAAQASASPARGQMEVEVDSARAETIDPVPQHTDIEAALTPLFARAFKEQQIELRRFMLASFETFVRRIGADIKTAATPQGVTELDASLSSPETTTSSRWPWLMAGIAVVALLPTVILAAFYVRILDTTRSLTDANARLAQLVAEQQVQINTLRDAPPNEIVPAPTGIAAPSSAQVETEPVGYGEAPLSGARVEKLRSLLARLRAESFKGTVRAESFVGDFCLAGNALEGFSLAAEDSPARRCEVTGNPFEDGLNAAQRQSLPFANLAASIAQETQGAIRVVTVSSGRRPSVPYPAQVEGLTAGEWNRAAARNNRVEFTIEPAG